MRCCVFSYVVLQYYSQWWGWRSPPCSDSLPSLPPPSLHSKPNQAAPTELWRGGVSWAPPVQSVSVERVHHGIHQGPSKKNNEQVEAFEVKEVHCPAQEKLLTLSPMAYRILWLLSGGASEAPPLKVIEGVIFERGHENRK